MVEKVRPAIPAKLGAREVMSADSLEASLRAIDLDKIMGASSSKLDPAQIEAELADAAKSREQVCALAARFATSELYRPLFEWLLDITLRRPIAPAGLSAEQTLDYVRRREGENAVAWQLLMAVSEGRDEVPEARTI